MKKMLLGMIVLAGTIFGIEEPMPTQQRYYFRMGTSIPLKSKRSYVISRFLNIGLGYRLLGQNGFDICTNHHYNPDVIICETEVSYHCSPPFFYGFYFGPTLALKTYFLDAEKFGETFATDIDGKFVLGWGMEREGRYSFIQIHLDRQLDLSLSSGIAF